MQVNPYLNFDGQCAEAFRFYEQVLGARIEFMQSYGDSPIADQAPPEWRDRVMHASLVVDDQLLMASDASPGQYQKPQGLFVSLQIDDVSKAEGIFRALAENGQVIMPFEETFWAARFGMLVDRFGIPWMVNCDRPEASRGDR